MPPKPVIDALNSKAAEIAALKPQNIPIQKYLKCYERLLHDKPSWIRAYEWLNGKTMVSRDDIKTLAAVCNNKTQGWPTLFTISMLWGYGQNDKAGPVKLFFALNTNGAEDIINETAMYVIQGNLAKAFVAIRGLDEIGPSYGTKFLFAIGQAYQLQPQPLVLDDRLAEALRNWWGEDEADTRFALKDRRRLSSKAKQRAVEGYVEYCREIQNLAGQLNPVSSPEQVEQFLFESKKG
jgi:hypothetical protein